MKNYIKNTVVASLIAVLAFVTVVYPSNVIAAITTYTTDDQAELVAYLEEIVANLQAQVEAQERGDYSTSVSYRIFVNGATVDSGSSNSGSYNTSSNSSSDVSGYGTTDPDRGESGSYDIELDTLSAQDVEEDEATIRTNIDLNGASKAVGFFEYGTSRSNLKYETKTLNIVNSGDDTRSFSVTIDDLDEDETYYYRPVAYGPDGYKQYGDTRSFTTDDDSRSSSRSSSNDDEPDVDTDGYDRVEETTAYIYGEADMNDYRNGKVFFIFGVDDDEVEDATDEDEYNEIETERDELMKFIVDSDLDDDEDYSGRLYNLTEDTRYYYTLCVEYEDDDDDETLECGSIEDFRTDD